MKNRNPKTKKLTAIIIISLSALLIITATAFVVLTKFNFQYTQNPSSSKESLVSTSSQSGSATYKNDSVSNTTSSSKSGSASSNPSKKSTISSSNSKKTSASSSSKIKKSPKTESSSSSKQETKTVPPEKVIKKFSFENKFIMPEPKKEIYYDSQNGNALPYCLFMPDNYSPSKRYPVILFLHGAGEIGTDNEKQLKNIDKMFKYNGDFTSNAVIICPQSYEWWNLDREYYGDQKGTLGSALHLLKEIMQKYSCDRNRVYVTGLSMGGYATWNLLQEYGDIFAAGIPICGGGNSNYASSLKDIPIRIYHGTADPTVSFSSSQNMYNAIINAGGKKVDFMILYNVKHNAWDYAFSDRDTFSWLFAQNKATNPTCKYEYVDYFKIIDSSGKTIISDEDISENFYNYEFGDKYIITIDLILSDNGRNKLKKAYTSSAGKPFTAYWSTQKLYTFTATKSPINNTFSMVDIFNEKTFLHFYDIINKIIKS